MATIFERIQPALLQSASTGDERREPLLQPLAPTHYPAIVFFSALVLSLFWVGMWGAYLWGYLGHQGFAALDLQQAAIFGAAALLPPLLFAAVAVLLVRAHALGRSSQVLTAAAENLFAADETVSRTAARLGRSVRRELDALNSGLDGAFARLRALETSLQNQIAALDEAGARAEVRGQTIATGLIQETQRLENLSGLLSQSAAQASETVAGRAAQLKATMETAEGTLKMAAQSLDVQAAGFRAAATLAAESPLAAAVELDAQAKRIETVSDAVMARAEFVLGRQEKHRAAMGDLLAKLKEDGAQFEGALTTQRTGMEQAIGALGGEARRFEMVAGDAQRHLELIMANAASRAAQLTEAFSQEAERLKQSTEAANAVLASLVGTLRDAGSGAQTLIGESAAQAKHDARALVGEAMAECEKLLRAAGEMSAEANQIHGTFSKAIEELERHLTRLPTVAQGEAQRIRQMMQNETEQMLDLSARAISTMHARGVHTRATAASAPGPEAASESDGLKGLARKLTQRGKRNADLRADIRPEPRNDPPSGNRSGEPGKNWEMKTLLAAVESPRPAQGLGAGSAAALGALEAALADMAVDLEGISAETGQGNEDWRRYLAGDRAVFARKVAGAIDDKAVDRITALYREDERFHDAADAYLNEFEALLTRAREGDGGGLLTSTILSADTGKIYLAIAYALGRL
jgi:hypothetical protein